MLLHLLQIPMNAPKSWNGVIAMSQTDKTKNPGKSWQNKKLENKKLTGSSCWILFASYRIRGKNDRISGCSLSLIHRKTIESNALKRIQDTHRWTTAHAKFATKKEKKFKTHMKFNKPYRVLKDTMGTRAVMYYLPICIGYASIIRVIIPTQATYIYSIHPCLQNNNDRCDLPGYPGASQRSYKTQKKTIMFFNHSSHTNKLVEADQFINTTSNRSSHVKKPDNLYKSFWKDFVKIGRWKVDDDAMLNAQCNSWNIRFDNDSKLNVLYIGEKLW